MARRTVQLVVLIAGVAAIPFLTTQCIGTPPDDSEPAAATTSHAPAADAPTGTASSFEKFYFAEGTDPLLGHWGVGLDVEAPGTNTVVFRFGRQDDLGILLDENSGPVEALVMDAPGEDFLVVAGVAPTSTTKVELRVRGTTLDGRLQTLLERFLGEPRVAFWVGPFIGKLTTEGQELDPPVELTVYGPGRTVIAREQLP